MFESKSDRKTRKNLDFQRRLSLIEIFCEQPEDQPLMETGVETGKVTWEIPVITEMIKKNPRFTLTNRGGDA